MRKIAVTGANGLLGWHAAGRLHAANCAARHRGDAPPFDLALIDRKTFADPAALSAALAGASAILHLAALNRASDAEVAATNPALADTLARALAEVAPEALVVHANSIHAAGETVYGRSKRAAAERLADGGRLFDLTLPHVFGEGARPDYNNVTATLIDRLWSGRAPEIADGAEVELVHAGAVAEAMIAAALAGVPGAARLAGQRLSVAALWQRLQGFHALYSSGVFPALDDPFDLALFNAYRSAGFAHRGPIALGSHEDGRGRLFEAARAQGGSQSFLSTTRPGARRGDHFHLSLVERFVVVSGEATIRVRRVLGREVHEYRVSGERPVAIDMPPLHTHHIVNDGAADVVTYFWAHRLFDPAAPDTFADPVDEEAARP